MASGADDKKDRGIRALNQEFRRYEQVRKDQSYGLSELPERDEFDEEFRIGTCDMGAWFDGGEQGKRQFTQQLGEPRYEPITALKFHTAITSKYYGDDYAVDD